MSKENVEVPPLLPVVGEPRLLGGPGTRRSRLRLRPVAKRIQPGGVHGGSMASFARSIHIEKRRISAGTPLARPFPRIRTADLVSVRPLHPSYRPSMLASLRP